MEKNIVNQIIDWLLCSGLGVAWFALACLLLVELVDRLDARKRKRQQDKEDKEP